MPDIEPPFDYHGRCVLHGRLDCPPCEAAERGDGPPFICDVTGCDVRAEWAWIGESGDMFVCPEHYETRTQPWSRSSWRRIPNAAV